ncbi:MAG: NADH-quinone oxidoreductase subunit NuoE [Clostridiaceae bacterium]|nr:NADH-quinone oxidoreductase subunit NuoE [Clostridiaceae bacterium]
MAKGKTMVPFKGTKEQEEQLKAVIAELRDMPGSLLPVLQKAQEIYGYLPVEVQIMVAEGLGIPLSEVYGVVTFYAQFALNPKGEHAVSVCLGTACYVKGAQQVLDRIQHDLNIPVGGVTPDGKFSLDACRCIGACGLAPVMMIDGNVYGKLTVDEVDKILASYQQK